MKTIFKATIFLIACSLQAQNFSGKAVYKTSRKSNFKIGDNSTMSDKDAEQIRARLQKMNQKTFILNFDKYQSTYKQEVALTQPKPQVGNQRVVVMSLGGGGGSSILYKNLQEKRFANKKEIMGKVFLVKDSLQKYDWEMTSETKNIGKYTCYKATFTREVTKMKMSMVNGESKQIEEKEMVTTTAWYTPQVPVSNGPKDYQGLPGLILEINDGTTTMVCTEIEINLKPTDNFKIEEPTKGKVVNQDKFNEIQRKKSKELMDRFKSRNGVDIGNGINIKMGG